MSHRSTLVTLALTTALGCNAADPPTPCDESSGAGSSCCKGDECAQQGPGLSSQQLDDLVALCNFVVTHQYNELMGNPPYQITPACRGQLELLVDMEEKLDTHPSYAAYKDTFIESLHALFFHPMAASADGVLFERAVAGDTMVTAVVPEFLAPHVQPMPLDWDIEMTTQTANTGLIEYWFDNIYLVRAESSVLDEAAGYNSGQIGIYNPFLAHTGDPRGGASTLLHELAHVSDWGHMYCKDACGPFPAIDVENEDECDCMPEHGAYMNGGAVLWALTMGGLAAHPPGVDDRILDLEDEYVVGPFWPSTETSTPGSLEAACRVLVDRSVFQRRTLFDDGWTIFAFCGGVTTETVGQWELTAPAADETPVAPPAATDLVCGHTEAQPDFSGISIVANTVTIPQALVDEAFGDIGLTLAGSWTEPVTLVDPTGATLETAEVRNLRPSSILAHIGLQVGDRITHVDGTSVADPELLLRSYPDPSQVQQVVVDLVRDEVPLTLTLQVQLPT